jgi:hypothetical protein
LLQKIAVVGGGYALRVSSFAGARVKFSGRVDKRIGYIVHFFVICECLKHYCFSKSLSDEMLHKLNHL